jgi:hypothetical protein
VISEGGSPIDNEVLSGCKESRVSVGDGRPGVCNSHTHLGRRNGGGERGAPGKVAAGDA